MKPTTNDLALLDQFAIAALPAVIAAATQTNVWNDEPHPLDAVELLYGDNSFECAFAYADTAYDIALAMLAAREEAAKFLEECDKGNQGEGTIA